MGLNVKLPILLVCVHVLFCLSFPSWADDTEDSLLLENLNKFRQARKLPVLTLNTNAACFAEQLADQFSKQPCTNSTGADAVPGTEPQLSNYPELLDKCHLNISVTREGVVLPDCVPGAEEGIAFVNYTSSPYLQYVNDTKFVSAGVASEDNWFVVVLATNTPHGNYQTAINGAVTYKNKLFSLLPVLATLLLALA